MRRGVAQWMKTVAHDVILQRKLAIRVTFSKEKLNGTTLAYTGRFHNEL
jgi:hypothetical protein